MIDVLKDKCCGCYACADACAHKAISFTKNSEGFYFPMIDTSLCRNCGLCDTVCPVINMPLGKESIISYAAYASNKNPNSSSGGVFSSLAKQILQDGGVVYGAAYNEKMVLAHRRVSDLSELKAICGSKYVQSDCSGIYESVKKDILSKVLVLFSGTPCQVASLKLYLKKDYDNLILIDLICHGVPSPGIFSDYLAYCKKLRLSPVINFRMRDNREGWNNCFKSTLIFRNRKEEYNSMLSNLWNRIFFSELTTRKSCGECKYASLRRNGDITIGDFWGIENVDARMMNGKGVSLVLINTEKGERLFSAIKSIITYQEAYTSETEHPNLYHSTKQNPQRDSFMSDYSKFGFWYVINKYFGYNILLDIKVVVSRLFRRK